MQYLFKKCEGGNKYLKRFPVNTITNIELTGKT